eukprot:713841-Rhodomonas_salina.1
MRAAITVGCPDTKSQYSPSCRTPVASRYAPQDCGRRAVLSCSTIPPAPELERRRRGPGYTLAGGRSIGAAGVTCRTSRPIRARRSIPQSTRPLHASRSCQCPCRCSADQV